MRSGEREAYAYHEAGRAVIARVLGLPCGTVMLPFDQSGAAQAEEQGPWDTHAEWETTGQVRAVRAACHAMIMSLLFSRQMRGRSAGSPASHLHSR